MTYELSVEGDALWLSLRNTPPRRLRKLQDGRIRAGNWEFDFQRPTDGAAEGFTVDAGRVTDIRFERR